MEEVKKLSFSMEKSSLYGRRKKTLIGFLYNWKLVIMMDDQTEPETTIYTVELFLIANIVPPIHHKLAFLYCWELIDLGFLD